jgi:hypothetical protein
MSQRQKHDEIGPLSDAQIAKAVGCVRRYANGKVGRFEGQDAQRRLAEEFGRRHGWRLSDSCFTLYQLGRRLSKYDHLIDTFSLTDHPFFYRETTKPYRPAALAVHLYDWCPKKESEVVELCKHYGLIREVVRDFPSWWYPGWTQLVLYTPQKPQEEE